MKSYKKPVLNVEHFTPNEFVAACGDTNNEYIFKCDAMGGVLGTVFYSDGDDEFEPFEGDKWMGTGYHACGKEHVTQVGDDFIEGWYVTGWDGITGGDWVKKVIIWRGPDGKNIHCTTNLNQNTWPTAKS
ncbi:hypothetical protein [uncultured Thomasclavelia sp.]|uniref:hypothetical protein n=1 Tax=uncultured Thomasclavelia sp. TaxID=3025759 RepID=UPI0025DC22FC|nr:hypothetical protein [uncultured Thomasclavelia sp.]